MKGFHAALLFIAQKKIPSKESTIKKQSKHQCSTASTLLRLAHRGVLAALWQFLLDHQPSQGRCGFFKPLCLLVGLDLVSISSDDSVECRNEQDAFAVKHNLGRKPKWILQPCRSRFLVGAAVAATAVGFCEIMSVGDASRPWWRDCSRLSWTSWSPGRRAS
jgi:hypothetical protein